MEIGQEYLSCRMKVGIALQKVMEAIRDGKEEISIASFPVENKEGNQPDYRGDISIWKNTKKEKQDKPPVETVV